MLTNFSNSILVNTNTASKVALFGDIREKGMKVFFNCNEEIFHKNCNWQSLNTLINNYNIYFYVAWNLFKIQKAKKNLYFS